MSLFHRFSDHVLTSRKWLVFLVIANLLGFIFGIYYYLPELAHSSPYLWIFIIDSPLYVLFIAVVCIRLLQKGGVPSWLYFFTSVGLIKVGFWTALVVGGLHFGYYFSSAPYLNAFIVASHAAMILEGLVLIPRIRLKLVGFLGVLVWFLVNDYLDYFHGTLTYIPQTYVGLLMYEALAATLVLTVGLYIFRRNT